MTQNILTPQILKLSCPKLIEAASLLEPKGKLNITKNNLLYLDIVDDYIHHLFPYLENNNIEKPNYFGGEKAGAHISVIYPEEKRIINKQHLKEEHNFIVKELVSAKICQKEYYILLIESLSLLKIRNKHNLTNQLCFKGYAIGFHITIAVSNYSLALTKDLI